MVFVGTRFFLDEYVHDDKYQDYPKVAGLPEGYDDSASNGPYRGLHPSLISRPEDPFQYPIPIGGIGPVDPYFSGSKQYPFLCRTIESRLGQPLVDNQNGEGVPVYEEAEIDEEEERKRLGFLSGLVGHDDENYNVIGYSKDCSLKTQAWYYYNKKDSNKFYLLDEDVKREDIARIEINGEEIDFIVRVEAGTINRFVYVIAAISSEKFNLSEIDPQYWNQRLVYQFRGGVGIGRIQGRIIPRSILKRRYNELKSGYAIAYSSGNQTSNHYNPWLAEETLLRVKSQFMALYGEPEYTVGVGGSGGAIQQYLIAQNNPSALDAIIPLYSYADMVTQTTYVLDCELLEYYFDVTDEKNPVWKNWVNRRWVEGLNSIKEGTNKFTRLRAFAQIFSGQWPTLESGMTECVNGWRGLTPLVLNPTFYHHKTRFSKNVYEQVRWTHWQDLKHYYGVDELGYGRVTWDNVGVQYGLEALTAGFLSPQHFIDLNTKVGSWKEAEDFNHERFWFVDKSSDADQFSPWSHHNMQLELAEGSPAPRREGDKEAMNGAYRAGVVFIGKVDIPVLDVRHYLEDEADMHHLRASFNTRRRMERLNGHADNQVVWVTHKPYDPVPAALEALDDWMMNIKQHPEKSVVENRPVSLQDQCMDEDGEVIAAGDRVWDGDWNQQPVGKCLAHYPAYGTPRAVAGAGIMGDVFKCQLQSVDDAVTKGLYSPIDVSQFKTQLRQVFPQGVCDYTQPDQGVPTEILALYHGHQKVAMADKEADIKNIAQPK